MLKENLIKNNKPNIVLISADQLRRDAIGVYRNNIVKTPSIDSIANEGVVFDNHIVQNPVCMPSRWSIFTGKFPRNHGVRDNGVTYDKDQLTLARVLKNNGYKTAGIGKMHFTPQLAYKENEDEEWPEDYFGLEVRHLTDDSKRGEYLDFLKEKDLQAYKNILNEGKTKIKMDLESNFQRSFIEAPQVYESKIPVELHQTSWIADKTIDFIEENSKDPFFIWCSFVNPHHPFNPPEPYFSMYDPEIMPPAILKKGELEDKPVHFFDMRKGNSTGIPNYRLSEITDYGWKLVKAKYYGMVSLVDFNIGRILKTIKDKKILNNTIIIITSDHGELLGDHSLLFKGPFHYDEIIRVPLIIRFGNELNSGSRVNNITQHIDLMPTILNSAGITSPRGVQGSDMQLVRQGKDNIGVEFALVENYASDFGLSLKTIRSKDWRFTYYANQKYGELYDLNKDPNEFENLWDKPEHKGLRDELMKKLLDILISTEDMTLKRISKY